MINDVISQSLLRSELLGIEKDKTCINVVSPERLKHLLSKNDTLCKVFRKELGEIKKRIEHTMIFLLTDNQGIVLDFDMSEHYKNIGLESKFSRGLDFSEASAGTNSISLSIELDQAVELNGNQHYLDLFKQWHCYATPIVYNQKTIGYLNISSDIINLSNEIIIINNLIAKSMSIAYSSHLKSNTAKQYNLSTTQLHILKSICEGKKVSAIASEMYLSKDTVNYHKKRIFKSLDVYSSYQAIAKAVTYGLYDGV